MEITNIGGQVGPKRRVLAKKTKIENLLVTSFYQITADMRVTLTKFSC